MFICFQKRAKQLSLKLVSKSLKKGVLFLCANGKVMYKKITEKEDGFILNEAFIFEENYIFCFINHRELFVGQKGEVKQKEKIIDYFKNQYEKICNEKKQPVENFDKNYVVDNIVCKLFSSYSLLFFEQTEKQLSSLFALCERAKVVESIIPNSKFIKCGEEGESSYVGVVYKNNIPYAIGIGFDYNVNQFIKEGSYQFVYDKKSNGEIEKEGKSFFFSFRRVSDADIIFLPL